MKLVLTQPGPWPIHELARGPSDPKLDPVILLGPLEPTTAPASVVVEHVIALERPAFATPELVRSSTGRSLLHWPVQIVESRIVAGDEVLERRLAYIYSLLEWWGAVVFRATPPVFERELVRASPILESGRPDWRPGVVALSELLEE